MMDADLAVVGAGPAGAATALFAARTGRRVLLIDRAEFPRDKPCGEGLLPSGRPPLRELGLEDAVIEQGAPPLNGVQFSLPNQPPAIAPFPSHNGDQTGLGVRRLDFDNRLIEAVLEQPSIHFSSGAAAEDVQRRSDGVAVMTSTGELLARHVVIADGLRSPLRHRLGWTVGPRPPHRYGIVAHWRVDGPVDPWVRITFADGLEVYEGPVAGSLRMIGLLCYQPRMREFGGHLASRYREIALAMRPELCDADQVGPVAATGPFWYRARTVAERGVFLVGDAAGFTDPITGEGIAAGLRQARAVVAALDAEDPEHAYRSAHRRLTTDARRIASLFLRLSRTPALVERGIRTQRRAPQILTKLLGVEFGYWGFNRITPREWLMIFTGR
ncbi:MAG TPA: FAD-dependent monooxygenase [Candidatus Angelobacter sp.]|nr:FAD-dependent monooxygenase [Candidatus Angelobacter sp.]